MIITRSFGWGLTLLASTALAGLAASPAAATALSTAAASAVLTITSITGPDPLDDLLIDGDAVVLAPFETVSGIGSADTDGTADFAFDAVTFGGLDQSASATAQAEPTTGPGSLAEASATTDGFLSFDNLGIGTFEVALTLEWSVAAMASVDRADGSEDALALALVDLSGDADFSVAADADTLLNDGGESASGVFDITLTLPPDSFADLFLLVDTQAGAFSDPVAVGIPVASGLPLMVAGLLALGFSAGQGKTTNGTRIMT